MSPEQEAHLKTILERAAILIEAKYRKGQAAHGGNLFELTPFQLIDETINEAVDQVVYLLTLKENLIRWRDMINLLADSQNKRE